MRFVEFMQRIELLWCVFFNSIPELRMDEYEGFLAMNWGDSDEPIGKHLAT